MMRGGQEGGRQAGPHARRPAGEDRARAGREAGIGTREEFNPAGFSKLPYSTVCLTLVLRWLG
jgi:hypothetical protein